MANASGTILTTFNAAAAPDARAERAFHRYDYHDNVAFERVRVVGRKADGTAFDVESDRLRPGSDLLAATRELANKLIGAKQNETPSQPSQP